MILPPGADFALTPSHDEPFGLVTVEFGRKGVLGVGSRLGGLGSSLRIFGRKGVLGVGSRLGGLWLMPGWLDGPYVVPAFEDDQRFPVVEWRQRMEDMHRRSILASRELAASNAWREADCGTEPTQHAIPEAADWNPANQGLPFQPDWDAQSAMSSLRLMPCSPGQWNQASTPNDESFLTAPPRFGFNHDSSYTSDTSDEGLPQYECMYNILANIFINLCFGVVKIIGLHYIYLIQSQHTTASQSP
ncbi:glycosyltransferase family 5 protein [Suillus luteus UH-Slu-Lm8-n1]|uniref:Unplaced genomic scaffold CY34scaffold_818, whole genome shotgun sequence n=1 Tax=Suillus luteus UH-Slu-Lm8-n1 TaxID=930992 RepID=A0A0D0AMZ5_9AGAM|nr:glycosyltransferase family 5 protein [Suillus luteus UH-Slu-Lm8-n1]